MPQGQYSLSDLQGQYSTADIDTSPTPAPQQPFLDRVNDRIGQNMRAIINPLDQIHDFIEGIKYRTAHPYTEPGQGFREIGEQAKEYLTGDPAHIVADAATAAIVHQMGAPPEGETAERPAAAARTGESTVATRLSDAVQSRIQGAAMRFLMKRIPGAHLAMDAADLVKAILPTEEAPKPSVPAGPVGPPEMWGKKIPQPSPALPRTLPTEPPVEQVLRRAPVPAEAMGVNQVPPEQRASAIIAKEQQEALSKRMESRGQAKELIEKGNQYPPAPPNIGKNPPAPTGWRALEEDQAIEHHIRNAAEIEDRQRLADVSRRNWAANQPGAPKGTLIEQATGRPQEKPVKYTKTPGVKTTGQYQASDIQTIPEGNEDLEPLLRKSVEAAKARRAFAER